MRGTLVLSLALLFIGPVNGAEPAPSLTVRLITSEGAPVPEATVWIYTYTPEGKAIENGFVCSTGARPP